MATLGTQETHKSRANQGLRLNRCLKVRPSARTFSSPDGSSRGRALRRDSCITGTRGVEHRSLTLCVRLRAGPVCTGLVVPSSGSLSHGEKSRLLCLLGLLAVPVGVVLGAIRLRLALGTLARRLGLGLGLPSLLILPQRFPALVLPAPHLILSLLLPALVLPALVLSPLVVPASLVVV